MPPKRRASRGRRAQPDLFATDPSAYSSQHLAAMGWPDAAQFPVNHAAAHTEDQLWPDLLRSDHPLLVTGFASIAELIRLAAEWGPLHPDGNLRVVLGTEPFADDKTRFGSDDSGFTEEVRRYWLEDRGISVLLSAKIIQTLELLKAGRLSVKFLHGRMKLHAKVYVSERAAVLGSSNFTANGLRDQAEANVRFTDDTERTRFRSTVRIAENYWEAALPWDDGFRALLESLLRFVTWEEALARACAELLEGTWARKYLTGDVTAGALWPSQKTGITQALWIAENVGSVLVADATGSGKTKMGAHLVRAVRDRLWSTGRVRHDLTVLVCPPAVKQTWEREALHCGLNINTVSHGKLSRQADEHRHSEHAAVRRAQILAVDEAHNFLTPDSQRTRHLRTTAADHVLLFTATPISRGAADLLHLVELLGADNFEDETLATIDRLDRRRQGRLVLTDQEGEQVRKEIQRFTVRRTKKALNAMVDADPESFFEPSTGRICRYPRHDSRIYPTGETAEDEDAARTIRSLAHQLTGVALLEEVIEVPASLRANGDDHWLSLRLAACRGLAAHHILGAMRSSRAALVEHLAGTARASAQFELGAFKSTDTGDVMRRLRERSVQPRPRCTLTCDLPVWLADDDEWRRRCLADLDLYGQMLDAAGRLSSAREAAKADLLEKLFAERERVLAFDHHLITLSVLERMLGERGCPVIVATSADQRRRRLVEKLFAPSSAERSVALCSDSMNEGINLQGASAIVHLDLPTTLRVAEQRVGRVDRMNSRYDAIEAWWPNDGDAFATSSNELLVGRATESDYLLGSNLPLPEALWRTDDKVKLEDHIEQVDAADLPAWDGIRDALDPVRSLVEPPNALVPPHVYREYRSSQVRVVARISQVRSSRPWAFFAVSGNAHGAPRWLLVDGDGRTPLVEVDAISARLRTLLQDRPESLEFDDIADAWLQRLVGEAERAERLTLPRRMQRALDQMERVTWVWAEQAQRDGRESEAENWKSMSRMAAGQEDVAVQPNPYEVAERWLGLVRPRLEQERENRQRRSKRRYVRLMHIEADLRARPLPLQEVGAEMSGLDVRVPIERRVSACILGVPDHPPT